MAENSKIEWKGDLEDDCHARVGNLLAHCECLGSVYVADSPNGKKQRRDYWFCSVGPVNKRGCFSNGLDLFHSGEHAGMIFSGTMARAICEAILRAKAYGEAMKGR